MEHSADWRPIEAAPPPTGSTANGAAGPGQLTRMVALGILACAALIALALVLWLATPQPELVLAGAESSPSPSLHEGAPPAAGNAVDPIVVDVQGAVRAPGLYSLPAGSRVGDAIDAGGGYAANADLEAAALLLNLAARLNDGDKVLVPRLGAAVPSGLPGPAATAAPGSGLIDLNTADEAALDTLPGVGPVTAAKIIAARTQAPFTSVDDLLARGVVGAATLDKIRALVSVGR